MRAHRYQATLTWTGAASGPTSSYQGYSREYRVEVPGKPPWLGSADPLFRGDPLLPNPEDWLLAALSACHMLSYLALAAKAGIVVLAYTDQAEGTMALGGGTGRFTEVTLHPTVTVASGSALARAEALHAEAHEVCFIANSVNFPVRHAPTTLQA